MKSVNETRLWPAVENTAGHKRGWAYVCGQASNGPLKSEGSEGADDYQSLKMMKVATTIRANPAT